MHGMRIISLMVTSIFFIWLLPLGVFIKPTQEKLACGGKRAVCMCSATDPKSSQKPIEGIQFKANNAASQKEAPSSGGAGHYFLAMDLAADLKVSLAMSQKTIQLSYQNPSLGALEHVPKA
jgi:hypothetical protein